MRELKEMIEGFGMLFGITPDVRIEVLGPHGNPTGTPDITDRDRTVVFFPSTGLRLHKVSNKYLTVIGVNTAMDSSVHYVVDPSDTAVTFHAAFYLP